ncbi:MAG: hypothetical protein L6262_03505 [Weeksellaceae bacterium]|nr:hypothetical protein [Weeksellaceae bacterium]
MKPQPKVIPGIPEHKKGSFHDTESRRIFENREETASNYDILKSRFFSVNEWPDYCGQAFADFKLFDADAHHLTRWPKANDLIRIDIPGPGNLQSNGYDWVKIINIAQNEFLNDDEIENIIITCVPTNDPAKPKNNYIAHFYSEKSSSTFKIARGNKYIKTGIYGRNETPNLNANFIGKIRNIVVAAGAMLQISKIEWKVLAERLLEF